MQIKRLHKNIYKLNRYTLSQEKLEVHRRRLELPLKRWEEAKEQSVDDQFAQKYAGISRASYYRFKKQLKELQQGILPSTKRPKNLRKPTWGESEKQLVLQLRRENPTYGKVKIAVISNRDHDMRLSESTVGRILKHLMGKGLIQTSASAPRVKRKRCFDKYAKPWRYGMKAKNLGEMIQIDHMTVTKNQITGKHFQAWSPIGKFIYANIYSNATSITASNFLLELIQAAPFKILSVQVDGGSEFMKDFEQACYDQGIELFVLPPKRPQWNGGVERGNRTFREEFYNSKNLLADSIQAIRSALKTAVIKYNSYRPHNSLRGLTPMQYIFNILKAAA